MEIVKEITLNILGVLIVLLVIAEAISYFTWNKRYFRFGIPIFTRTIPITGTMPVLPVVKDMEALCPSSFWGPSIKFREIGQGEYAFREGPREGIFLFFGLVYPLVMRGYLTYDNDQKRIRVKGYIILIPLVIFGALSYAFGLELGLIVSSIFIGLAYLIQSARYNAVASMAAGLCAAGPAQKINAG